MRPEFNPEIWLTKRKKFNPGEWLHQPQPKKQFTATVPINSAGKVQHDVEIVLRRIEAHRIDLTMNYEDWIKLGFAFASEFGEAGRGYYHRVSRFYIGYDLARTDRQFDKCAKAQKSGITIRTFFAAARDAGVNIRA